MVLIEQLLSKQEVNAFREQLGQVPWNDGKETAMGMAASVKNNRQADANNATVKQLTNQLLQKIGNTPKLISAALPHRIFPPCFNRYAQSENYGFHVDAAIMRMPHNNEVLRSDMSMTIFFSEPEEYQGGELVITSQFGEQKIKANAGDAILYPSSSLHKVNPVAHGERIAAVTWMQSLIPDMQMRNTMFELDQSIQTLLTNPSINRSELDRLHNVYHNLIRQQSQV